VDGARDQTSICGNSIGDVRKFAFIESAVGGAGFESIWSFNKPNPAMTFIPFLLSDPLAESLIVGREEIFLHHLWNTFTHNKVRVPFEAWKPCVEAMKRPGLIRSSASYYRAVYAAADRIRELIDTGKLTIPVLSISGEASFGEAQKPFVEAFAGNIMKHVVVPNSGHFVAEAQPEALAVAHFLATSSTLARLAALPPGVASRGFSGWPSYPRYFALLGTTGRTGGVLRLACKYFDAHIGKRASTRAGYCREH
jgi:pimeloyl-ACP methyl ester carboxylesterase